MRCDALLIGGFVFSAHTLGRILTHQSQPVAHSQEVAAVAGFVPKSAVQCRRCWKAAAPCSESCCKHHRCEATSQAGKLPDLNLARPVLQLRIGRILPQYHACVHHLRRVLTILGPRDLLVLQTSNRVSKGSILPKSYLYLFRRSSKEHGHDQCGWHLVPKSRSRSPRLQGT